ncbi:MAG: transglutaminase domain-containing protein [Candidatus Omnitrophota bacterium]
MSIRRKNIIVYSGLALILGVVILFGASSTRQGVNCVVSEHAIPRWIKITEFLSRHYHYQQLAAEITKGYSNDEEKLTAIVDWTRRNIHQEYPADWPIYDDHVLNIIIRGYGTSDQFLDVCTLFCTYAGLPAAMYQAYHPQTQRAILLAVVKLNGRFILLDPARGNYFRNRAGELASISDIIAEPSIVERAADTTAVRDKPYAEYFSVLTPIEKFRTLRAELQIPGTRISYEIKRRLGLAEVAILFYGKKP